MHKPSSDCPLTPCIKILAGAWTLEIIYFLRHGAKRFGELRRLIATVSAKVLTSRLRELEQRGIITRAPIATRPPTVEYSLTPMGRVLLPVIDAFSLVSQRLREEYPQATQSATSREITK